MQPTSAGHVTQGFPKSAQHFLDLGQLRQIDASSVKYDFVPEYLVRRVYSAPVGFCQ
jgi:hypothetical protein